MSANNYQSASYGGNKEEYGTTDEKTPLTDSHFKNESWDVFLNTPPKEEDEVLNSRTMDLILQVLKLVAYIVTFTVVIGSAIIAKGSFFFMTSQLKLNKSAVICQKGLALDRDKTYEVVLPETEKVVWIWCIFFTLVIPEFFTLFRSSRICIFKSYRKPLLTTFITVFIAETLHTIGLVLLVYVVFPELDVLKGAMLTNCVGLVPAVLQLLSRSSQEEKRFLKTIVDIVAITLQVSGLILWPLVLGYSFTIPVAGFLVSFRWWENYVDDQSPFFFIRNLGMVKKNLKRSRYFIYTFIPIWKVLVIFCGMMFCLNFTMEDVRHIFVDFMTAFRSHPMLVSLVQKSTIVPGDLPDLLRPTPSPLDDRVAIDSWAWTPISVMLIQVSAALTCYIFSKFACKIYIQKLSFSVPLTVAVPVTVSLLIGMCGTRNESECFFENVFPKYLFWTCFEGDYLTDYILKHHDWLWMGWILSQAWISLHIWAPKCERLAATEKLFVNPLYVGPLIDQSIVLNRRRDDSPDIKSDDHGQDTVRLQQQQLQTDSSQYYEEINEQQSSDPNSDHVPKIYACATMWHETSDEMIQMLKSVLRMDFDQCSRRNFQKYTKIIDPDYYEFEAHIFFDDAFDPSDTEDPSEVTVNQFVKLMTQVIGTAAQNVYETESIYIPPPKKTPTPYGGRLVWRMPGNNLLIAHLKDKVRIRHRKRWSQVMYMYYLLGHRLMEMPIDEKRKEVLAENTYILTLDGDINFRPRAVRLLVDLMKKNRNLGAACGRIHPVGSGPMVWYQKFEYAIGHWLQKATEHMIGCVLCSPGCFSLFRAKALMDDNVMRKYTTKSDEAKHYVQYDQGEDRWLCTLLLQRGYRVEYSAASDAYTHCPEGFGEFYTQRRRWAPSTMANIMDLLMDYKRTVAINDNISVPYIIYQTMLMVGTILGPGTIFLMLVGAMVAAFKISNWYSFYYNIIPILLFMAICFIAKNDIQILVAQIMSAAYALLMMAVLVGTAIQLSYDGIGSPSSIFLIALSGSFFIAALLHPQEFWCVVPGLLYFLSIPSMYLLLIIYSLVNLNVVTWGTREVLNKKEQEQQEEEKKKKKMGKKGKWLNSLMANANVLEDEEGSITVSLANLFKCMFCTYPKPNNEQKVLESINDQMREFSAKLVSIESSLKRKHHHTTHHFSDDEFQNETKTKEPKDRWDVMSSDGTDVMSQGEETKRDDKHAYWLDDKALSQCKVEYLEDNEVSFWNGLIEKYLFPLDQDKEQERRVAVELKELRNKVVFFFFMFNALFILIVFLLQLNKDRLHIDWPLGVKFNITYIPETSEVRIDKEYLELEPIGLVFAVFFALILIIQFVAMLFHRFGTFSHMLAAAEFNFFNAKTTDELNPSVNDIASEVLNIGEQDDERDKNQGGSLDGSYKGVANRNVVGNLINHHRRRQPVRTMDYLFKKRFENLNRNPGGTPILGEASGKRRRNGQGRAKVESLGIKNSLANGGGATTRHRSTTDVRNLFPEDQGPYHLNRGYQQEMDHGGELEPHLPSSRNSLNGSRYGRL